MAGFESYTDLSRRFGRQSDQRRNPGLYREQQQKMASDQQKAEFANAAIAQAEFAPFGSLEQRNNPMNYGSVFRRENPGFAGAYDNQQATLRREKEEKAQEEQDKNMLREQARRESLARARYSGSAW